MRRYMARNDFRNTTNAFDGVHWQIGEGQTWRFRAFLVEPVFRDDVQLDEQTSKEYFLGGLRGERARSLVQRECVLFRVKRSRISK